MDNTDIPDPLFRQALDAIDEGDTETLTRLLRQYPRLVQDRLETPTEGYFSHPYLLWFIADNPIRKGRLAPNIVHIARILVAAVKEYAPDSSPFQVDYALGLTATGRIPRECGVQIGLIDLLIDAGAAAGEGLGALAHGNVDAARHLITRGGRLTLPVAACLGLMVDFTRLLPDSTADQRQTALVAAAFYGKTAALTQLIETHLDLDAYPLPGTGFHSHATALHQAVWSGSLEAVKILIQAGARTDSLDKVYGGTPLGWAEYKLSEAEPISADQKEKIAAIAAYLRQFPLPL